MRLADTPSSVAIVHLCCLPQSTIAGSLTTTKAGTLWNRNRHAYPTPSHSSHSKSAGKGGLCCKLISVHVHTNFSCEGDIHYVVGWNTAHPLDHCTGCVVLKLLVRCPSCLTTLTLSKYQSVPLMLAAPYCKWWSASPAL